MPIHPVDPPDALASTLAELRPGLDLLGLPCCVVDAELRYRFMNPTYAGHFGRAAGDMLGRTLSAAFTMEPTDDRRKALARALAGETLTFDRETLEGPNAGRWVRAHYMPVRGNGAVTGAAIVLVDIQHLKDTEEELRRAHSVLSAHFENTPLAVIEWNHALEVIRWSGNAESIFGWSAGEVTGRSLEELPFVYEEDAPAWAEMVRRLIEGPASQATILNRNHRKEGSVIWVEWHNSAIRDAGGRLVSILALAHDVSIRIQAEERLQFMATHDLLTGLPNRLLLHERLTTAISRAQRFGHGAAVMFLDLDNFKDVNDTLGHRVGDELLKSLAKRIRASLRQSDLLVRLSGDEFVIVLEDLEGEGGPDRVAEKILADVKRPFAIEGHEVQVSASLGYALYPEDGRDADALVKNADIAMYHAKELGRNSFRAFSATLARRRDERVGLESALRRANRQGEFELHYQPIFDMATGRASGVEALVRWRDPQRGVVLPPAFLPVAEESGLMRELGHWILETAARQAVEWRGKGVDPLTIGVNLSAIQLRDPTLVAEIEAIFARTGCAPGALALEVNETSMVKDLDGVGQSLRRFRDMGLRIALDNFGAGFSSLSHLRHLPVDSLKIGESFVADIDDGPRRAAESGGAAIVAAVTGFARGLGLEVVACGVERPSQLAFLREQGCAAYQGFLACPPLPAADLERWIEKASFLL